MARLRLEIPDLSDEEVQRLIAALAGVVPGVDLKIEVETTMATQAATKKAKAPSKRKSKGGRPMVSETGQKLAFHPVGLEPSLWAWVRLSAEAAGLTPNRFLRQLILDAKAART